MINTRIVSGLNVQEPWATLLINGEKSVETRSYSLPKKYEGVELALIATPGKKRNFKAKIIGVITFSHSFQYQNTKEWIKDSNRHCIVPGSEYYWDTNKQKYGWVVSNIEKFNKPLDPPIKRGIIFVSNCLI
jgi:predicted transcriptional regulator